MEKPAVIEIYERPEPVIRAVVRDAPTRRHLRIRQFAPLRAEDLPWLAHAWLVQWDMPDGQQHAQRTVPFPAFNLVADAREGAALHGCARASFAYGLRGRGHVLGLRLRPAAQRVFWGGRASALTDGALPAAQVLPPEALRALTGLSESPPEAAQIAQALSALHACAAPLPAEARDLAWLIDQIATAPALCRVSDVAARAGRSERALQQLFSDWVGLTPKRVIDRFRIHDALEACAPGTAPDFAGLALRLGYFDQAHFSNAFKAITGHSPAQYLAQSGPDQPA